MNTRPGGHEGREEIQMFDIHSFANWSRIDCKACKERAACDQVPYDCPLDEPPLKYPRIIKESGYTAYFMEIQPLGDGLELPIYRFPGGSRCVDFPSACEVIKW